jgi:hypothetical protein
MHTWWPSGADLWYQYNPSETQTRVTFYAVDYVPAFRYDGKKIQDLFGTAPNYPEFFAWLDQAVDSLRAIPSPIRISITNQYLSSDSDSVYVSFDVVAEDTIIYETTPVVCLAAVERNHPYPSPTLTWKYGFRDLVPGTGGGGMTPLSGGQLISIQKGDSLHFDWAYPRPALYNISEITTAIWVQNEVDPAIPGKWRNKVLQAASMDLVDQAAVPGGTGTSSFVWLGQNAPNPFNHGTTIAYQLTTTGRARMAVYAPTGQLVKELVNTNLGPGSYTATWDGSDRFGHEVSSGMYYYRLDAGNQSRAGRMVLLR